MFLRKRDGYFCLHINVINMTFKGAVECQDDMTAY